MVSSTTITSAGAPALISAMQRAIEVGVRDHAFSTRAFCAASSASFCAFSASLRLAAPAILGSAHVGQHAGIDREVVGEPPRAGLDLKDLAAPRNGRAWRVPDFLEERPAE